MAQVRDLRGNTRRVGRIRLGQPLFGRLDGISVLVLDLSIRGARLAHTDQTSTRTQSSTLHVVVEGGEVDLPVRVVRTRLERFVQRGGSSAGIYETGVEFEEQDSDAYRRLRGYVDERVQRALEEQVANAKGVSAGQPLKPVPPRRPRPDTPETATLAESAAARAGYVSCTLRGDRWTESRIDSPEQPVNGFTVSASESPQAIALLCSTYRRADEQHRNIIRVLAALSIDGGDGVDQGRFEP